MPAGKAGRMTPPNAAQRRSRIPEPAKTRKVVPVAIQKTRSRIPIRRAPPAKAPARIPPSEMIQLKRRTFNISTLLATDVFCDVTVENSPPFAAMDKKALNALFVGKCRECSKLCDFSIVFKDGPAKATKQKLLGQFCDLFATPRLFDLVEGASVVAFYAMVQLNIARPFPRVRGMDLEFGDEAEDMAWPHLDLVYCAAEALFQAKGIGAKLPALPTPSSGLTAALVGCLMSPDGRERKSARNVLKALVRRFPDARPRLMRYFHEWFLAQECSSELLDVYRVVLADSAPGSRTALDCVLRLHCSDGCNLFGESLTGLLLDFVRVEPALFEQTVEYLLRHWPVTSVKKQIQFVRELKVLLGSFPQLVLGDVAALVFGHFAALSQSPAPELAAAAIGVVKGGDLDSTVEDGIGSTIMDFADDVFRLFVPALAATARRHWSPEIREEATAALDILNAADETRFRAHVAGIKDRRRGEVERLTETRAVWARIVASADRADPGLGARPGPLEGLVEAEAEASLPR